MVRRPNRILVVRTDRLGDVIISTPLIKNLRVHFPDAHLAFMCRPYTRQALEGNPDLNEVIVYDKYGKHKNFFRSVQFALSLRRKRFDWAIILHPTNRAHLVTFLAGIPVRVGWDRKMAGLLTKRIPHRKQEGRKHELDYTLDILGALNIPVVSRKPYFPLSFPAAAKVRRRLEERGVKESDRLMVIHPSASCPSKRWPPESFSQLIKLLQERFQAKIVVITSSGEKPLAQKIIDENTVIDLRGEFDIAEVGALLKRADLFISNDSGPVHIAASLGTPVISIFGRTNPGLSPRRWRPLGPKSVYLHMDPGCRQCRAHNCQKGFICLNLISPSDVLAQAESLLL